VTHEPHAQRKRVAVLISGRGSNMTSLIAAAEARDYPAEIALVLSNRPDAEGLTIARGRGVSTVAIDHKQFRTREHFEEALHSVLEAHRIEIVCLAGFMRLLTTAFVETWRDRMINIHPALLPSYKGLHTHERALADGVKIHGCTVHFVVPDMDSGPIIVQSAIAVRHDDTVETLSARVLAQEHVIYPRALRMVAAGEARVEAGRVVCGDANETDQPPLIAP
jgi:phosphoribosylglycinamide formyltransferase-1